MIAMHEYRATFGDMRVVVYTVGSLMVVTHGQRLVEVGTSHDDGTVTLAPPPKQPRYYRRPASERRVEPPRATRASK